MKEKLKNKKVVYTIIGIVSVLLVALAVTYAYWLVTKTQTGQNQISSACLNVSINDEKNDITLTNHFPLEDAEGMILVPYEFTVTNNCNTSLGYQITLEAMGTESTSLKTSSIKVALNDKITLLSDNSKATPTISGAYESRKLLIETLKANGSASYELRIWIDANAPVSEANKTFLSKISVTVGEGIGNLFEESLYKVGTLAYDILENYGGEVSISEISTNWTEGAWSDEMYLSYSRSEITYWGTELSYARSIGKYTLAGTVFQATAQECRDGLKSDGTSITCSYTLGHDVSSKSHRSDHAYKITSLTNSSKTDTNNTIYLTGQLIRSGTNAFTNQTTTTDVGLYRTQDDLGNSYYFRGNPTNNYVQFGSYAANTTVNGTTYDQETPMYWRIVRINGDGTIRLAYDGTTKAQNGASHDSSIGASSFNTNAKEGYTYDDGNGNQVDSTIKGALDTWYDTHLKANYGGYIADSIFCNDRSEASYTYYDADYNEITDQNAAVHTDVYYGAYYRLEQYRTPSLKCTNISDRYNVDDTATGNGLLSNPIGLLTADEVVLAGGYTQYSSGNDNSSRNFYLKNGDYTNYWTMTPTHIYDGNSTIWWYEGGLSYDVDSSDNAEIRPVINLKADVQFTGTGTIDDPYKIVTE